MAPIDENTDDEKEKAEGEELLDVVLTADELAPLLNDARTLQ